MTTMIRFLGILALSAGLASDVSAQPRPPAPPASPAPVPRPARPSRDADVFVVPPVPPLPPAPPSAGDRPFETLGDWAFRFDDYKDSLQNWQWQLEDLGDGLKAFKWEGQTGVTGKGANRTRAEMLYEQGRQLIEQDRFDRAVELFDRAIADGSDRGEPAMYWKAYSLMKLARRDEALATLATLQKTYPKGRWVKDAQALEIEVKQAAGKPVSADGQVDEELKLLALRSLTMTEPTAALPAIERIVTGPSSVRVKDRALFLLSQVGTAQSRALVLGVAKGNSNPELQLRAIRYLGMMKGGSADADMLVSLYSADASPDVRRAVIQGLAMQNNAKALVTLARSEKSPELKAEIVRRLSMVKAPEARDYLLELLK